MDNSNSYDESFEDNPPPVSTFRMQLVLNKCRPYLSLPEDETILVERLNELGVNCLDDLKLLNFENDLKGIIKIIQCRQLQLFYHIILSYPVILDFVNVDKLEKCWRESFQMP